MKDLIWILEDDADIRGLYTDILSMQYELRLFENLKSLESALKAPNANPKLLIADLCLPDGNFLDFFCEGDNCNFIKCPFLVVSSLDDEEMLKKAFIEGAVDYLTKPFGRSNLLVKIERLLSKPTGLDKYNYDFFSNTLSCEGKPIAKLSLMELRLFAALKENNSKPIPREDLYKTLWNNCDVVSKTLDVHISNLRRKVVNAGLQIKHIRPNSFQLIEEPNRSSAAQ